MDSVKKEDKVNHPSHYTWLKKLCGIEVIDITRHMCFNLGNVVKYVLRAGHKSEEGYSDEAKEIEDLKKAKWYLEDEIKLRSGEDTSDQAQIKYLKEGIKKLQEELEVISLENYSLRKRPTLGEVKLAKSEILKAAEIIQSTPDVQNPITLISHGGSGIGTETELHIKVLTEDGKTAETIVTDITDVSCW